MPTRTHLTGPPGTEPTTLVGPRRDEESYVRGLAIPEEPTVPGRHRRLAVTIGIVAAVAVIGTVWFRSATAGQDFDPAVDPDDVAVTPTEDGALPGDEG